MALCTGVDWVYGHLGNALVPVNLGCPEILFKQVWNGSNFLAKHWTGGGLNLTLPMCAWLSRSVWYVTKAQVSLTTVPLYKLQLIQCKNIGRSCQGIGAITTMPYKHRLLSHPVRTELSLALVIIRSRIESMHAWCSCKILLIIGKLDGLHIVFSSAICDLSHV